MRKVSREIAQYESGNPMLTRLPAVEVMGAPVRSSPEAGALQLLTIVWPIVG
jgi:hypothetical protein